MAEVVTSSLLRLLFDKLSSNILKEFGLLVGVDKQLRKLENTLSVLHDVLDDAEVRQVKEKALKEWLRKLKDVAYDVDDVLDDFAAEAMKCKPEVESPKEKVRNFFVKPSSIVSRHKIARRIKEIRESLNEIAEERSKFHLREGIVQDYNKEESIVREQTGSFVNEYEVYGRQMDRDKITEFLISESSEDDLGVMAIVGLGGLGKTTVAQLVYNDERVCQHFEQRVWVCVSDDFDNRKLSRSIVESITGRACNLLDLDSIQCSIRAQLRGKRYLLVLDDVWNENHERWDKLRTILACGGRGSKIVVTTRSERVASIMITTPPHFLAYLSESDCWSLFERRAFGLGGAVKDSNLVSIGEEIVKKCGGVPLAAKALGSLMRFKRGESEWLSVKDNEIWKLSDNENEILPALMLSYNHLPSRLKQCFAYCSIFPKDYDIRKEKLVQLWVAEGFVRSSERNTHSEDVGYECLDELLSRSLFQNGNQDGDGVVRQVRMHDLVHDLARFVAGDECSIIDAGDQIGNSKSLRYSSFICNEGISSILQHLNQARKLRTFHFIQSSSIAGKKNKAQELLDIIFSNLKLIRALHITDCPIKGLSESVKNLKHLRYLNLSDTELETLPQCIGLLRNLQTLNISHCTQLKALPESISDLSNLSTLDLRYCSRLLSLPNSIGCLTSLRKLDLSHCQLIPALPESLSCLSNLHTLELRHCYSLHRLPKNTRNMRNLVNLDTMSCYGLTCMPPGIGQLSRLRTFPLYVLGGENSSGLAELGGLNLEGVLEIKNLETVRVAAEARDANMKEKQKLRTLDLEWDFDDVDESLEDLIEASVKDCGAKSELVKDVLEALQPHENLEVLWIKGVICQALPKWLMEFSLPNLVELSLTSCIRCEQLPAFGQLPYLKVLKLCSLPAVKFFDSNGFSSLEELVLVSMLALEEWPGPSSGDAFPSLIKLSLSDCPKLKALPFSFPSVKKLCMYVDDALLLSSLQNGAFPNLERLDIGNCEPEDDCTSSMPKVLAERIESIKSWSVTTKPDPRDCGSLRSFGFAMLTAGDTVELEI